MFPNQHFTLEDWMFMLDAVNGIRCTPETLLANIWCSSEFVEIPESLWDKLKLLTEEQIDLLYAKLYQFWDIDEYTVPVTEKRLQEIGITLAEP